MVRRRRWGRDSGYGGFPAYVPAGERRAQAEKEIAALRKKGREVSPVVIQGTKLTTTFWGKAWCDNLESYSDYESRLPRGRTYARNGSILHLAIANGKIEALVRGTSTYTVTLTIEPLAQARWTAVVDRCAGQVASLVELLEGKLSRGVMEIVTDKQRGIFPGPGEISLACTCLDWASMCKHVAASMYGVGARLDRQPELLFLLRGVDPAQLIARSVGRAATRAARSRDRVIADDDLAGIFGIELDTRQGVPIEEPPPPTTRKATRKPTEPRSPRGGSKRLP